MAVAQDDWWEEEESGWNDAIKKCKYGPEHHDQFIEYDKAEWKLRQLVQCMWDKHVPEEKQIDVGTIVEKLLSVSQKVVRIQRKHTDPNRDKMRSSKEPGDNRTSRVGNGTGVFVHAGPYIGGGITAGCSTSVSSSTDNMYNEFIFQSDPRSREKLKHDLKKRSFILTNSHVIWSEVEAASACADFFFEKPGSGHIKPEGLVRVNISGMYELSSPRVPEGKLADSEHLDFCLLTFYVKEPELYTKIGEPLAFVGREMAISDTTDILVCFGHPHGTAKRMSTGHLLESVQNSDDSLKYEVSYRLPTCSGSSGSYAFSVGVRSTPSGCWYMYLAGAFLHFKGVNYKDTTEYSRGRGIVIQNIEDIIKLWFESKKKELNIDNN